MSNFTNMEVTLLDYMGSELSIVNSARVSFAKESEAKEWIDVDIDEVHTIRSELKEKDIKLIRYLANHGHWTPFAHVSLQFRIKAPLFVARQLGKHQVGLVWNEVSRRYVDSEPEFYLPDVWRYKAQNKKQGSTDDGIMNGELENAIYNMESVDNCTLHPKEVCDATLDLYNSLIDMGICPEQARMVLPQNMMTEWIWSGSLFAFMRVCNLRCAKDTQLETQFIANKIYGKCYQLFPVACHYLNKGE